MIYFYARCIYFFYYTINKI
ncbi:hypothetical protein [Plasmodium yoelii yoelii]|uniref:Uncharacterized protein n=1 Tax=Plasmodium yoelii yoelii TaxID=73239 RepID=Q7RAM1_PLAYO|nr:hypothetical protein [Plasmodium yoelii yoelii]